MTQRVSAEVALYPLRTPHLAMPIEAFLAALDRQGLDITPGRMSTIVEGTPQAVFDALRAAFQAAAAEHDVVLRITVSNTCPHNTAT